MSRTVLAVCFAAAVLLVAAMPANAASVSLAHSGGAVAFTFDAGYASDTRAASILEAHGMRGTFYVVTGQLRQGSFYADYLSSQDVANLSTRGHEIGSMGVTQVDLTTVDATRLRTELADSQSALRTITGRAVNDFAYPYGAVNDAVASATSSYYASGRVISWYATDFASSVDAYHVPGFLVRSTTTLAEAEYVVDYAVAHNVDVVFAFQRIVDNPGQYDWTPANLDALAAYAQAKGVASLTVSSFAGAAPTPPPPPAGSGTIVFTFDDGQRDQLAAAQALEARGFRGTFFIVSNCPKSEVDVDCMTQSEVVGLSDAGHDIESHTVLHHDLATLSAKQLPKELTGSQSTLKSWTGTPVRHLAYPYGSTSPTVELQAAKSYRTARLFYGNPDPATLPAIYIATAGKPMELPGIGITQATSVARAEAYVDYAATHNTVVVLAFHDIVAGGASADAYSWDPANLNALLDYVAAQHVPVKTMAQVYG